MYVIIIIFRINFGTLRLFSGVVKYVYTELYTLTKNRTYYITLALSYPCLVPIRIVYR